MPDVYISLCLERSLPTFIPAEILPICCQGLHQVLPNPWNFPELAPCYRSYSIYTLFIVVTIFVLKLFLHPYSKIKSLENRGPLRIEVVFLTLSHQPLKSVLHLCVGQTLAWTNEIRFGVIGLLDVQEKVEGPLFMILNRPHPPQCDN